MKVIRTHPWIIPTAILLLVLTFSINLHALWGDEAETALFAQNVLRYGVPYGWDGENIMGLLNGIVLNNQLVNSVSPWAQYYIAAFSFQLFGVSTVTARLFFAIFSLACIPLTYYLAAYLTKDKRLALVACFVLVLSVPFLLFSYQSRYYSVAMFCTLLFTISTLQLAAKTARYLGWSVAFVLSGILFFYSHYLSFAAYTVALLLSLPLLYPIRLWWRRIYPQLALIFFLTMPWFVWMKPYEHDMQNRWNVDTFIQSLVLFYRYLRDFNTMGIFPVGAIVLLLILMVGGKLGKNRKKILFLLSCPLIYFFLFSFLSIQPVRSTYWSDVRYAVNVLPFLAILSGTVVIYLYRLRPFLGIVFFILLTATNLLSFGFPPQSYIINYLYELRHPYLTATDVVVAFLDGQASDGDMAFVSPDHYHEPLMFYLQKKIRFVNRIQSTNPILMANPSLPEYVYAAKEEPRWFIFFGTNMREFNARIPPAFVDLAHYETIVFPLYSQDETRPEIFWHSFAPRTQFSQDYYVYVLKKKGTN